MITQRNAATSIARFVLFGGLFISLVSTGTGVAGAAGDKDYSQNATTEIQVCEAMGGKAEVDSHMTANEDNNAIVVDCKGGAMDGLRCYNDSYTTECWKIREIRPMDKFDLEVVDIAPLHEPATPSTGAPEVPPVSDTAPDEDVVGDEDPTPTPSPEVDSDPVIDVPVVDDPEISDDPAGDDSSDEGGKDDLPGINVDPTDILPIETPEPFLL